jgi:hypothetical protein
MNYQTEGVFMNKKIATEDLASLNNAQTKAEVAHADAQAAAATLEAMFVRACAGVGVSPRANAICLECGLVHKRQEKTPCPACYPSPAN